MTVPAGDPAPAAVTATVADPALAPAVTAPEPIALPVDPVVADPAPKADPAPASTAVTYEATGDAGLDVALAFVGKLGITMDDPAMQATSTGDFSLIRAKLATMADAQGWEQMVALAEQAHERHAASVADTAAKVASAVHMSVGGEEQWATIKTWAGNNATADEKAAINAMFEAGPVQARAAAIMLKGLYEKASGTTVEPASVTRDAPASAAQGTTPLNRRDFVAAVDALAKKVGSTKLHSSPEYAALVARRKAYQ